MPAKPAQSQLDAALEKVREEAYSKGIEDGFSEGWQAATKSAISHLVAYLKRQIPGPSHQPKKTKSTKARAGRGQVRTTVASVVAELGPKGAGATLIAKKASEAAGNEFSINSVRAALASLLKSGEIAKTGPNWHRAPAKKRSPARKTKKSSKPQS